MDKLLVSGAYEKYIDTLVRAAWHYTGELHSAQDSAEEAFLRLLSQEDMEDSRILPWLIKTTVNIAKDHMKSAEHRRTVSLELADEAVTDDETELAKRAFMRAMLSLPEKYRLPLLLYLSEGYTINETAELIGKKPNTVSTLIRRGRKLLQKAYEKEVVI
ncbi:MAG: RNA polymerase sigma factor [Ruminococcus sp.]|nr:RNA polymerase sigma factor [Ruminococcus sp.]